LTRHFKRQPGFGDRPVPLHRRLRDPQGGRGLLHRQAGEEAQLDDAGLLRVVGLEVVQEAVDGEDVGLLGGGGGELHLVFKGDPDAGALLGDPRPALVDQHPPHHLRRDPQEVQAVLPVHPPLVEQAQIDLVDQAGRLQREMGGLVAQQQPRQPAQLLVDDGDQPIEPVALGRRFRASGSVCVLGLRVVHAVASGPS
jgi:hypothetical protein